MVAANGVKLKAWLFTGTQKLCEVLRAADTHVLEIRPKGQRGIFAGVPRRRGREAPPKSAGPASGDERLSEELATPKSKTRSFRPVDNPTMMDRLSLRLRHRSRRQRQAAASKQAGLWQAC